MLYFDTAATSRPKKFIFNNDILGQRHILADKCLIEPFGFDLHAQFMLQSKLKQSIADFSLGNANLYDRVLLFPSATHANNFVLDLYANLGYSVFFSKTDHASIVKKGEQVGKGIDVQPCGSLDLSDLESKLSNCKNKAFVSVSSVSNETGIVQDLESILKICEKYDAILHSDCVQGIEFSKNLSSSTISFHKMGGPKGIAALILPFELSYLLTSCSSQINNRLITDKDTFTIPIPNSSFLFCEIVMALAIKTMEYAKQVLPTKKTHLLQMRDYLVNSLQQLDPEIEIIGGCGVITTSHIINVYFPMIDADAMVIALSFKGICISAGSACSSGAINPSPALLSMGFSPEIAKKHVRISIDEDTKISEIDELIKTIKEILDI